MKKLFLMLLAFFLLGFSTSASAYTFGIEDFDGTYSYGNSNAGTYLGTVYGDNDSVTVLNAFLVWKGIPVSGLTFLGKTDENTLWMPLKEYDSENQLISGTWQTYPINPPVNPNVLDFLIVKGGTSFSVHQYSPSASSGQWNVGYLDEVGGGPNPKPPALSHLSGYYSAVPEPGTMLLLGGMLFGLGVINRKRGLK